MKAFKIQEAWDSMEHAVEHLTRDTVWVMQKLFASGADGINFDTTAAAGDADMYGTLHAIEALRKEFPDMYIEAGMAGEMVLGMHGGLQYDGVTLAGLWPHQQAPLIAKAGANVFGPVCNTNTSKTSAWNLGPCSDLHKGSCCSLSDTLPCEHGYGCGRNPNA